MEKAVKGESSQKNDVNSSTEPHRCAPMRTARVRPLTLCRSPEQQSRGGGVTTDARLARRRQPAGFAASAWLNHDPNAPGPGCPQLPLWPTIGPRAKAASPGSTTTQPDHLVLPSNPATSNRCGRGKLQPSREGGQNDPS